MTIFRITAIIMGLLLTALAAVHLRWSNAHYAYLIQQEYARHNRLTRDYYDRRLELAAQQSPQLLLKRLREWKFPLEGWVPSSQPTMELPYDLPGPTGPQEPAR